jgi:cysteine desulfurase/selenocysteine lyase
LDIEKIRQDFPILQKKINEKSIIYLDSSCMSLKPKQVINKMNEYYHDFPACGGRSVHRLGTRVTISVDSARKKFQNFLNAKYPEEIVFLRNATEGLNLVANSLQFNPDDRVLITDREHNSNLIPWLQLKAENRIKLEVVPSAMM